LTNQESKQVSKWFI